MAHCNDHNRLQITLVRGREPREAIPAGRDGRGGWDREQVAWQRAEEAHTLGAVAAVPMEGTRGPRGPEQAGVVGALRASRVAAGAAGERRPWGVGAVARGGGAARARRGAGSTKVLGRWREDLEQRHRRERVALGKAHFEEARAIELAAGEAYRGGMEGSEQRAEVAARTGGSGGYVLYDPPIDHWKLRSSAEQERLEQVQEIYGEQAYEERKRAWERASPPLVLSRFPSHDRPQRRGPERGGPERDYGPSR